ncbi:MAG TPA: hypothetical protein VFB84_16730 [Micromonosporaceae bacterium]|nr:hypothetical protein [Micromonosporaceae bacterium]
MTKRVTVSLPDDVAAYLATADNASAAVADAMRAQMDRRAATEAMLRAAGFEVTEAGKARARAALARLGPEQRAEIDRRRDLLQSGDWPAEERRMGDAA